MRYLFPTMLGWRRDVPREKSREKSLTFGIEKFK